jgi:hypothetical protein
LILALDTVKFYIVKGSLAYNAGVVEGQIRMLLGTDAAQSLWIDLETRRAPKALQSFGIPKVGTGTRDTRAI